jgi:hypothetical protein
MDKFNRTNFYNEESVDAIIERDMLTNTTDVFNNKTDYSFYVIKDYDLLRPDLISFRLYGSLAYWWILMKVNDIEDIWNDLYVGKVLVIPKFSDIEIYYDKNKKK